LLEEVAVDQMLIHHFQEHKLLVLMVEVLVVCQITALNQEVEKIKMVVMGLLIQEVVVEELVMLRLQIMIQVLVEVV
tara:strand:- start:41 stop:271 length:231 start_codon:yes stop_codon:yes gene_type:complete